MKASQEAGKIPIMGLPKFRKYYKRFLHVNVNDRQCYTYIYCAVCRTTVELFAVRQNEKAKCVTY